jgi:hypothetical protein
LPDDPASIDDGGWLDHGVFALDDLRRIRREIDAGYIGPKRAAALARLDQLIADHDRVEPDGTGPEGPVVELP